MTPSEPKIADYKHNGLVGKSIRTSVVNLGWRPDRNQLRQDARFEVYCNACGEKVVEGKYWKLGEPNFHYWDIAHFHKMDYIGKSKKDSAIRWKGTFGINIDPKSHELRCECCCGNNWKVAAGIIKDSEHEYKGFEFRKI